MNRIHHCLVTELICLMLAGFFISPVVTAAENKPDDILLTIVLKHDQSKTLREIDGELEDTGFWTKFPPEGTEIVSWYVVMGMGQVVTLRLPPEKLRDVNLVIEQNAWGAFKTEFYATYDFRPVWETSYKGKAGETSPQMQSMVQKREQIREPELPVSGTDAGDEPLEPEPQRGH